MPVALKTRGHTLLRSVLFVLLAFYIFRLNESGTLHFYLAPHMQKLLLLCPVPLLLIALAMLISVFAPVCEDGCSCGIPPASGLRNHASAYGLLSVPLLLGLLFPDEALGSEMAAKKGMAYAIPYPGSVYREQSNKVSFRPTDAYSLEFAQLAERLYAQPVIRVEASIFSETLGAIERYQDQFRGKKISLQGFVFRDGEAAGNHFAVSRFLVMCCTADALPFGVQVKGPAGAAPALDGWVEVTGTLESVIHDGREILQVHAESVKGIEQPSSPYIYTSPDSVEQFDAIFG